MHAYKKILASLSLKVDHRWHLEKANRRLQRKAVAGHAAADSLPFGTWADHYAYYLVASSQQSDQSNAVLQADLDRWGISFEEACKDAFARLYAATSLDFASLISAKNEYELHESTWENGDHAARLNFPALAELPVPGERLIFPLSRSKMIVVGSDSIAGMASVIDKLAEFREEDALPPLALVKTGNNFAAWQGPVNHPYHSSLKNFSDSYLSKIYAEQYDILIAECGCDPELFIAKFMLSEDRRKFLRSQATIIDGVDATSLPKTDYVVFARPAPHEHQIAILGAMAWDVMLAMLPGRLTRIDCYPERYLLNGFPTDEELNRYCPESFSQFAVEYISEAPDIKRPARLHRIAPPNQQIARAQIVATQLSFAPNTPTTTTMATVPSLSPGEKFKPTDVEF
jgi:hypothetical protein